MALQVTGNFTPFNTFKGLNHWSGFKIQEKQSLSLKLVSSFAMSNIERRNKTLIITWLKSSTGEQRFTRKLKQSTKIKSLRQVTRGIAENTESLICGRTENISGDWSDPASFICSKYTHGVCSSRDALKRESEPPEPLRTDFLWKSSHWQTH